MLATRCHFFNERFINYIKDSQTTIVSPRAKNARKPVEVKLYNEIRIQYKIYNNALTSSKDKRNLILLNAAK